MSGSGEQRQLRAPPCGEVIVHGVCLCFLLVFHLGFFIIISQFDFALTEFLVSQ